MIDLYCERLGPGLWAEPFNAVSNVAYIIAAVAAWVVAKQRSALTLGMWILIILAMMVGVGSGLFHTFATGWARVCDVVPILLFQVTFLWLYFRKFIGLNTVIATIATAAFLAVVLTCRGYPQVLNTSLPYLPVLIILLALGFYHFRRIETERGILLIATGVFFIAFTFRTIDLAVCPVMPIGTHFLWHLLTGCLLYLSMRTMTGRRVDMS